MGGTQTKNNIAFFQDELHLILKPRALLESQGVWEIGDDRMTWCSELMWEMFFATVTMLHDGCCEQAKTTCKTPLRVDLQ